MKKSTILHHILIACFLFFGKNTFAQNLSADVALIQCGEVQLFVNGGTTPYTIDWGDGTTSSTSNNFETHFYGFDGTFLITITDAQGEIVTDTIDVFSCFIDIVGDTEACVGDCSTYFSTTSTGQGNIEWNILDDTGNIIFENQGIEITYCWGFPGDYTVVATDFFSGATASLSVNVMLGAIPIDIVSLSNTFCQADSLNPSSCEKICANSTAIYTIPGGQNVVWEVLGADSYTPNGNQVTVEWGAPGSGQVTATASTSGSSGSDLEVDCNSSLVDGVDGPIFSGSLQISGGTPPYTASWSDPTGNIITTASAFFITGYANMTVGIYTATVTDATGVSESCNVYFSSSQLGCFQASDFDVVEPSDCNSCDGEITVNVYENNSNPSGYFYQWSNGSTVGPTLTGVCAGFYSVTVTNQFGCDIIQSIEVGCDSTSMATCPSTTSLCIDILEDPDAKFTTIPAAVNGVVNICEGGTVIFNNESEGATLFEWDFGNGNISTSANTEQTYLTAGTYTAYLISRNDCYCSDTSFVTIEVADAISPFLDCVGTICENTTSTYTTDANCGTFNWTVTGDYNIVDGGDTGDNFITIEWLAGPEGIIELSVAGCAGGNYCLEPTMEVVPIISDNATIRGPEKVCRLDEATYFIDDYSATDFVWTVSTGGTILEGQNTSTIKVRWDGPTSPNTQQFVSVDYDNCYLGCGGSDTKDVYILPELFIAGDLEACENGMSTHEARKDVSFGTNTVNSNWTVTNGSGTVIWTSAAATSQINLNWNTIATGAGRYAILAIPDNLLEVCNNDFTSYINVVEPPTAPTSIDGITQICAGEFYTYEVNTPNPDYIFNWTINDGGVLSNQTGKAINVSFGNTPPYILSVTQTSTDGFACESDAVSLEVFPIPNFSITGDNQVCEEKEGTYTADFFEGVNYEWSITPLDAGTIITGQNSNVIEVFWHTDGAADVEVTMCNMTEIFPVTVIAKPEPVVSGDLFVCPSETTIVGTVGVYDSYLWKTESGNTITNTPIVEVTAGAYELIVTNSFGCENNISFVVVGYPEPSVNISVPGSRGRCYTGLNPDPPAELHATEIPTGYTYEWFYNNTPIPNSNSSVITSSDFGIFHVVVSDQFGCETSSNPISIFELCNFGGGVCNNPNLAASCDQGTDVTMTFSSTSECDVFDFQNTSPNFLPGTVSWNFDDPSSGSSNTTTVENPTHQFSSVGYFIVTVTALTPAGALCWDSKLVTVPIKPNFNFSAACINSPISFQDLTEVLPNENVQSWSWDFGDPSSGANNTSTDQNPSHIFASAGMYTVTLTASHANGCTASISKTITVENPPTVDFDEPTLNCQRTALSFIAQPSPDVLFYEWDFGDPTSGNANTSEIAEPFHAYENAGNYSVTCTVTDIWGCSSSTTKTVTVEPNTLNGNISFSTPSPICDGDVTTLTAPTGGVAWEWSDGSITESITTGEAGAYSVTVTNDIGCQYIPPTAVLDIIALPSATIQAVEYDEFGQPANVFYDNYATCEGEDVFLQVVENTDYTYTWSDGTMGNVLEYSEDRNNLLSAGTYSISLDILDNNTGCSNTVGPFDLVIHPTPVDIQISSSPSGFVCENTLTTFFVVSPSIDLTYVWNTGEIGTSIQAVAGGEYFVRGITMFGCSAESNKLEILPGPDLKKIPDGCHTRCKPDTICLPTINNIASYQWYLNGVAISGPSGTVSDYIALESGAYHVVMTDIYGCESTSDILSLDLLDGFGTFEGNVYMDVNDNGIIDGADTLINGIDIILMENGVALDTVTSGVNGEYTFANIVSTSYNLSIDESVLPFGYIPVWNNLDSTLFGCNDLENVDWLLQFNCINSITDLNEETCFGVDYIFDGTVVPPNSPMTFTYVDIFGCDSIINVSVTELSNNDTLISLNACDGNDIIYNGVTLIAGSTTDFPMVSAEGCNYTETVEVIPFPTNSMIENFEICEGETITYNGEELTAGTQMDFTFQNQFGCDSVVSVTVTTFPEIQFDIQINEPCWNSSEGVLTISNTSGTAPLEFSLGGSNYQTDLVFENVAPTNYTLQARDGNGCEVEEEINFLVQPQLIVQIPPPLLPCDGSEVTLTPQVLSGGSPNLIYEWSNGSVEEEINVSEEGTYLVSVSNDCESVVEEVQVMYEDEARGVYFYIPNAFSPDGDGYNDIFKTYPSPDIQVLSYDMYIFDRWGNQLYDTHNVDNGWNGKMNNKDFDPGVFVYYIRANIVSCGRTFEIFRKGDVTITN